MYSRVKSKRAHLYTTPSCVLKKKKKKRETGLIQFQKFHFCCVKNRSAILKIRCTHVKKNLKK